MTDEERQKLVEDLWQVYRYINNDAINELILQAAAEIKRLAAEVKAWRMEFCKEAADEIERLEAVRAFAKAILHGDDEHKAWLTEAAEAFVLGKPLPPPRGKGTAEKTADEIERLTKELAAAEAALRNTLLHYKVSDVHFLGGGEMK